MRSIVECSWILAVTVACGGRAYSPSESGAPVTSTDDGEPAESFEPAPGQVDLPPASGGSDDETIDPGIDPGAMNETDVAADEELTLDEQVVASLERFCGSCHGAEARASDRVMGGLGYIDDLERLVDEGYLIPLNAEGSTLIQMMRDGTMPPGRTPPRPSRADIQAIADYVNFTGYWGDLPIR